MRARLSAEHIVMLAVAVTAVAAVTARSLVTPLFASADEMAHFDYAYQVWHGHLPVFENGLEVQPPWGSRPPVQWTAQHPPLFYLLLAPAVGPLMDAGHPYLAGLASRGVNALITGALCVAVIWAARPVVGQRREVAWIAGFLTASSFWVQGVGSAIYNDNLAALVATLVLGGALRLLRQNAAPSRMWWAFGAAAAAAALCRLSIIPIVALALALLVLRGLISPGASSRWSWFWRPFTVGLAMLASGGWFFLRNLRLTGSVSGGHPEWAAEHTPRDAIPVMQVITDPASWTKLFGIFSQANTPSGWSLVTLLIVPLGLAVVGAIGLGMRSRRRGSSAPINPYVILMLVLPVVLVIAMQFTYVSKEVGSIFPRYSLPVVLCVTLAVAAGLGWSRRAAIPLVSLWSIACWVSLCTWLMTRDAVSSSGQAAVQPIAAGWMLGLATAAAITATGTILYRVARPSATSSS